MFDLSAGAQPVLSRLRHWDSDGHRWRIGKRKGDQPVHMRQPPTGFGLSHRLRGWTSFAVCLCVFDCFVKTKVLSIRVDIISCSASITRASNLKKLQEYVGVRLAASWSDLRLSMHALCCWERKSLRHEDAGRIVVSCVFRQTNAELHATPATCKPFVHGNSVASPLCAATRYGVQGARSGDSTGLPPGWITRTDDNGRPCECRRKISQAIYGNIGHARCRK